MSGDTRSELGGVEHGPQFGDRVLILKTEETASAGYAGREGFCHGFTTPSITGVNVIGYRGDDLAFNVSFDEEALDDIWFAPDCIAVIDRSPGLTAKVGDTEFVRDADGTSQKVTAQASTGFWQRRPKR